MEKVNKEWNYTKNKGVYLGVSLYDEFKNGNFIHAVELDSHKKLYDRLLCLSGSLKNTDDFILEHIQAAPNSSFEAGFNRKYKGAGTALMYGLIKTAQKTKAKMFKLFSLQDNFYNKLGMILNKDLDMTFNPAEMGNFLKRQKAEWKALSQKST
jgi:hypothetical protein